MESKMSNYNSIDSKRRFEDGDEMETSDDYISDNDMSIDDEQDYDVQDNHVKSKSEKIYLSENNKTKGKRRSFTLEKKIRSN